MEKQNVLYQLTPEKKPERILLLNATHADFEAEALRKNNNVALVSVMHTEKGDKYKLLKIHMS